MLSSQMYKEAGLASLVRNNMASSSMSSPMYEYSPSEHLFIVDPRTWCFTSCDFPLFSADLGKAHIVTALLHMNFKYFLSKGPALYAAGGRSNSSNIMILLKGNFMGSHLLLMIVLLLAQAEEFFHDP